MVGNELLGRVVALLGRHDIPHALIGAAALGVHVAPRASLDLDLLVQDRRVLDPDAWRALIEAGEQVRVRRGEWDDPLVGVVVVGRGPEFDDDGNLVSLPPSVPVDLVIVRGGWADALLERTWSGGGLTRIAGVEVRVVSPADLILLKLYAGGPRDLRDIEELLGRPDRELIATEVEARVGELPDDARAAWSRLRT